MKNKNLYTAAEIGPLDSMTRVTLKEKLELTGAEVSANRLPAGSEIPFSHSHKRNEEIYIFISGKGLLWLDGEKIPVMEGTAVRVSPLCVRTIKADETTALTYFCIQVDEGSLVQATREDGIISKEKAVW
jgi:mannose-6-phosphate isomerase-like protein (cupin superfamily)